MNMIAKYSGCKDWKVGNKLWGHIEFGTNYKNSTIIFVGFNTGLILHWHKSAHALYLSGCFLPIPLHFLGINHVSVILLSTSQAFTLLPHIMWHKPWPGNQYEGWLALICVHCYPSRWHSAVWPLCALHCTFLRFLTVALQCAVCSVQRAVSSVQRAVCSVQCAACIM